MATLTVSAAQYTIAVSASPVPAAWSAAVAHLRRAARIR